MTLPRAKRHCTLSLLRRRDRHKSTNAAPGGGGFGFFFFISFIYSFFSPDSYFLSLPLSAKTPRSELHNSITYYGGGGGVISVFSSRK